MGTSAERDGSYTFTPDANWNGDVDFSYEVTDRLPFGTSPANHNDPTAEPNELILDGEYHPSKVGAYGNNYEYRPKNITIKLEENKNYNLELEAKGRWIAGADGEVWATQLLSPSGKTIALDKNAFTTEEAGEYTLVLDAKKQTGGYGRQNVEWKDVIRYGLKIEASEDREKHKWFSLKR